MPWHIFCVKTGTAFPTFQFETEIAMKTILAGLALALTSVSAFAAVEAVPAPAIGLGVPAIAALIVVCVIGLLLKRIKA